MVWVWWRLTHKYTSQFHSLCFLSSTYSIWAVKLDKCVLYATDRHIAFHMLPVELWEISCKFGSKGAIKRYYLIQNINIDGLMWFLCRINTILMQCFKYPLILFLHCPCLCCHSFLWYHVVFLSGSESLQGVFLNQLFIYVSQLEIQLSRGSSRDPINRCNTATYLFLF